MSFRLVSKSVTLNDSERRNGRYFALFQRIRVASGAHCVKVHVRYLTHLLISSCCPCNQLKVIPLDSRVRTRNDVHPTHSRIRIPLQTRIDTFIHSGAAPPNLDIALMLSLDLISV